MTGAIWSGSRKVLTTSSCREIGCRMVPIRYRGPRLHHCPRQHPRQQVHRCVRRRRLRWTTRRNGWVEQRLPAQPVLERRSFLRLSNNSFTKFEGELNIARFNVFAYGNQEGVQSDAGYWSPITFDNRMYNNTFYRIGAGAWRVLLVRHGENDRQHEVREQCDRRLTHDSIEGIVRQRHHDRRQNTARRISPATRLSPTCSARTAARSRSSDLWRPGRHHPQNRRDNVSEELSRQRVEAADRFEQQSAVTSRFRIAGGEPGDRRRRVLDEGRWRRNVEQLEGRRQQVFHRRVWIDSG